MTDGTAMRASDRNRCLVTRPMSGRGDRPVAPAAAWMHALPDLSGYASDQPDLWMPKRIHPTLDE